MGEELSAKYLGLSAECGCGYIGASGFGEKKFKLADGSWREVGQLLFYAQLRGHHKSKLLGDIALRSIRSGDLPIGKK
jgi:hypothetical protein